MDEADSKNGKGNIISIKYPITLKDLLKADIPPIQYIIKPVLPKGGKLLISASPGVGKTFLGLNLGLAIASGISHYINEFEITKKPVLYIAGEGGIEEIKRRLDRMATIAGVDVENLFLAYEPCLDLFDGENIGEGWDKLKSLLEESGAEVVIIDPIGQFWSGNENEKNQVKGLTSIFDYLMYEKPLSLILTHHWKKPALNMKSGGHMASGSYWWTAWVDGHITLNGTADEMTLSVEKVRSGKVPEHKLILSLKEEDFWFRFKGFEGEPISREELDKLFESFGLARVKLADLAAKAKVHCSRNTLEKIIRQSPAYYLDESDPRCFYVCKK